MPKGYISRMPPAAVPAMECTDPRCVSGTQPAAAQTAHGQLPGQTAGGASSTASAATAHAGPAIAINCPPSAVAAMTTGGDGPGC